MSHMMHFDGSRPPPTPREMYSEGMYASIEEQGHYDHKKQAPPPPKRDPNTRLSSSSQMMGVNNYQEIEVHEVPHGQYHSSHHQQHHHQQSHHHHQQQSHHHHYQQQQHHQQQYYQQQQQYIDHHSQQQQHMYNMQQQQQQHTSQQHQYNSQQQQNLQMQQHQQQYYSQQKQQQSQQHHGQQQHLKYEQQQSPRHTVHDSPTSRSKFNHEPQSPSHSGDKPFSYGLPMSPKLNRLVSSEMKHTSQNGNGHTQTALKSPTRSDFHREESPVMSYGKHESTFPSQAHRPPPHGPPPPVPQQGSPSPKYPSSPVLPRHSVTSIPNNTRIQEPPRSPIPKLSQRSMSVPCNGNTAQQPLVKPQPVMSAGFGYNGMSHPAHRTPSPPLPPPPPELMDEYSYPTTPHQQQYHQNQHTQQTHMLSQMSHGAGNQGLPNTHTKSPPRSSQATSGRSSQAPPPPPLNLIPRKQTNAPTNINTNVTANTERMVKGNYPLDVNGNAPMEQTHRGKSHSPSVSPMRGSVDSAADQTGLLQQISKVQLKKTGRQSSEEGSIHEEVQTTPTAVQQPSPQTLPVSKGSSPILETEVIPVNSAVDMFEKKVESVIKEENRLRRKGDTSKDSSMDFNIDDIDLDDVPGYTPVTKSTPIWKRDMIEKKNQEKIEEYIAKKRKEKEDAEKWKHVPAWKRKLMMEKEKEKEKKTDSELKQPATPTPPKTTPATPPTPPKKAPVTPTTPKKAPVTPTPPKKAPVTPTTPKKAPVTATPPKKTAVTPAPPKTIMKEEEELRKAKIKEQKEMEKQMEEELQDVPAWKREIMMKRGGAIKNWTDEREDINEQELDGEDIIENSTSNKEEPIPTPTQPPPPQPTQQSKASVVLKPQLPKEPPEVKKTPKPAHIDESKLEEEWDSLPLWKREIMMKRGGAPSNWGDEREDKNDEGLEQ
ncbi:hypothetical protein ACF0H5_020443 [Mactra antiquata]